MQTGTTRDDIGPKPGKEAPLKQLGRDAEIAFEIMAPVQTILRSPGDQHAVDIEEDGADHI
ncbi:hypothetical protein ACQKLX_02300 [Bosea sp. NPDC003192]|uniref:hypothetical protein n=1 Tax=Bosea sp. NPDC003192 TaxID=3390551 RepID=UPI003D02DE05